MSRIERLLKNYARFISAPWRSDTAAAQRVVFCIYSQAEELRLQCHLGEFELATRKADHGWMQFDFSNTFPAWMADNKYAESYFRKPDLLPRPPRAYLNRLEQTFEKQLQEHAADGNTVVALSGVGSLYPFLKVREVVDAFAPRVPGRLLVFFPGRFENNTYYHLLDAYDGWNYLAFPITSED
jgi:hypothetical protein